MRLMKTEDMLKQITGELLGNEVKHEDYLEPIGTEYHREAPVPTYQQGQQQVTNMGQMLGNEGVVGTREIPDVTKPSHLSGKDAYIAEAYRAANEFGVDPQLLVSMMEVESAYNPRAVSKTGAMGLMQLMPGTAREVGVTDAFDPIQNIRGGAKHTANVVKRLKHWGKRFGIEVPINSETISAAYNMGTKGLVRHMKKYGSAWKRRLNKETKGHIRKVSSLYDRLIAMEATNGETT